MNMFALFAILLSTLVQAAPSNSLQDNPDWIRYQDYRIHLKVPSEWRVERDLYGMPITALGPERNGERAVLSVQHTGVTDMKWEHSVIASTQKVYFDGRKEWLSNLDGSQFLSEIPYQRTAFAIKNLKSAVCKSRVRDPYI